jgi:hypothetical protein
MYDRAYEQPFTWKAAAVFVVTGVGLYFYFESEKAKVQERRRTSHLPPVCHDPTQIKRHSSTNVQGKSSSANPSASLKSGDPSP